MTPLISLANIINIHHQTVVLFNLFHIFVLRIQKRAIMKRIAYLLMLCCLGLALHAQTDSLKQTILGIINRHDAQTGVAVIFNSRDTLTVNNDVQYPLMSVFKFHQALAVADYLSHRNIPLTQQTFIRKKELKTDTYSPLRDRYPEGDIYVSYRDLLTHTLQLSDNNACDILFSRTMSPKATARFLRKKGIKDFAITATEDDMHKHPKRSYDNWSTPLECTRLIEDFLRQADHDTYLGFIKQTMTDVQTGMNRLPKPLKNTSAVCGHKTGTGDRNPKGEIIGINDIGFVYLPDGSHYSIAVLIKDFKGEMEDAEQIIADISAAVYHSATGN